MCGEPTREQLFRAILELPMLRCLDVGLLPSSMLAHLAFFSTLRELRFIVKSADPESTLLNFPVLEFLEVITSTADLFPTLAFVRQLVAPTLLQLEISHNVATNEWTAYGAWDSTYLFPTSAYTRAILEAVPRLSHTLLHIPRC